MIGAGWRAEMGWKVHKHSVHGVMCECSHGRWKSFVWLAGENVNHTVP